MSGPHLAVVSALQPLVSPWAYYLGRRFRLRAAPMMKAVLR